jgi:hypothetical protein
MIWNAGFLLQPQLRSQEQNGIKSILILDEARSTTHKVRQRVLSLLPNVASKLASKPKFPVIKHLCTIQAITDHIQMNDFHYRLTIRSIILLSVELMVTVRIAVQNF